MLNNISIQDLQTFLIGLGVVGFFFFCLFIACCFSIIGINSNLKKLVNLEQKKYNDRKGKDKDVSSTPPSA